MSARFIDNCESGAALRRCQNQRFLHCTGFNLHQMRRVRCEKIDGACCPVVVIVRFYFRPGFGFQVRQLGKMRMNERRPAAVRMYMEQRSVSRSKNQGGH